MKNQTVALLSAVFTFVGMASFAACSSSSSSGSTATADSGAGSDGATAGDTGVINDPDNCVAPGTANNSFGVGGYCSPLGGQCDTSGPGGAARICTADLTSTPAHAWFCTYLCSHTSDCGSGEVCFQNPQGAGCIPSSSACLSLDADAGFIIVDDAGATDAGDGG
ncbi:MAG: hypothetical protein ABI183_23605 [Polyangiaceae bacterium]